MILARLWPLPEKRQFQSHQLLATADATGAHGVDSIWAYACPNKGRCGQGSPASVRSAIGSGALSSAGMNHIRSHPAFGWRFQVSLGSEISVGEAVFLRL